MKSNLPIDVTISVRPVIGGFIVTYPKYFDGCPNAAYVTEVVNTVGKAMILVKAATKEFSLVVGKDKEEAAA